MPQAGRTTRFTGALDAVILLRGEPGRVAAWVERGTVPAYVVDLEGPWCAVVPAGPGHAVAPYDDGTLMSVARPTPMTMRPSVAFFPAPGRAVVVVQPRKWRALPRWLVVQQGLGPIRAYLPQADPNDLLEAVGESGHRHALERVLDQVDAEPCDTLRGVMAALGIAAGHLLNLADADDVVAELVHPATKSVRRFDKHVSEERDEREEIEGWSQ